MSNTFYIIVFLASVFLASCSQILLKKSAQKEYPNRVSEYLNPQVIIAYLIFFSSTLLTIWAYKGVPLSLGPIFETTGYIYVVILSALFLQERITKRKLLGNILIIAGIISCSLIG
jgi:small multidrug resistance pump